MTYSLKFDELLKALLDNIYTEVREGVMDMASPRTGDNPESAAALEDKEAVCNTIFSHVRLDLKEDPQALDDAGIDDV